jgi:hypothetical protein
MRTSLASALCYLITHCTAQPTNSKLSNSTVPTTNETITCISPADAILIANGFGHILSNFSMAFGDTLIAEGYTDQSDSVATLSHSPNLVASDVCLHYPLVPFSLLLLPFLPSASSFSSFCFFLFFLLLLPFLPSASSFFSFCFFLPAMLIVLTCSSSSAKRLFPPKHRFWPVNKHNPALPLPFSTPGLLARQ